MAGVAFAPGLLDGASRAAPVTTSSGSPFGLGIASGDPLPDGVVLWTRLARNPFAPGGGMGSRPVRVEWEIAHDESMTRVVRRGAAQATAEWGHSVHIDVRGLAPAADYFYRFRALGAHRPGGRAPRRLPTPTSAGCPLRWRRARTGPTVTTTHSPTSPRTHPIWCFIWATTSTRSRSLTTPATAAPARCRRPTRPSTSTTTGNGMPCTNPTPICNKLTQRRRSRSPSTTTRSTTTGLQRFPRTTPPGGVRRPTRERVAGVVGEHPGAHRRAT